MRQSIKLFYEGLIILLCLSACSHKNTISLPEQRYYLCNYDFDSGIELFDSFGNAVLNLDDAEVFSCFLPDGTIISPTVGQIPAASLLLINIYNNEIWQGGVWDVDQNTWVIEPMSGACATKTIDTKLYNFIIGSQEFNLNFQPSNSDEETIFKLGTELQLKNAVDIYGYTYICKATGEEYLTADSFRKINCSTNLLMLENNIHVKSIIQDKYMLIAGTYTTSVDNNGMSHISELTYLCDSNGVIQYPDWNYTSCSYIINQFGQIEPNRLVFSNNDTLPPTIHYLDLDAGKELSLPPNYSNDGYKYNGLFLLESGGAFYIYDSYTQEFGSSFSAKDTLGCTIIGKNTYIRNMDTLVIENQEQLHLENNVISVIPCEYPIVTIAGQRNHYIFDNKGNLILRTKKNVVHADSLYYLCLDNNTFTIYGY